MNSKSGHLSSAMNFGLIFLLILFCCASFTDAHHRRNERRRRGCTHYEDGEVNWYSKEAECKLRKTLVLIDSTHEEQIEPRMVEVNRCYGDCGKCKCLATHSELINITVHVSGEKCSQRSTTQHTSCICWRPLQCKEPQEWNEKNCRCQCPSIEKQRECNKDNRKIWYNETCTCACSNKNEEEGCLEFDDNNCKCTDSLEQSENYYGY